MAAARITRNASANSSARDSSTAATGTSTRSRGSERHTHQSTTRADRDVLAEIPVPPERPAQQPNRRRPQRRQQSEAPPMEVEEESRPQVIWDDSDADEATLLEVNRLLQQDIADAEGLSNEQTLLMQVLRPINISEPRAQRPSRTESGAAGQPQVISLVDSDTHSSGRASRVRETNTGHTTPMSDIHIVRGPRARSVDLQSTDEDDSELEAELEAYRAGMDEYGDDSMTDLDSYDEDYPLTHFRRIIDSEYFEDEYSDSDFWLENDDDSYDEDIELSPPPTSNNPATNAAGRNQASPNLRPATSTSHYGTLRHPAGSSSSEARNRHIRSVGRTGARASSSTDTGRDRDRGLHRHSILRDRLITANRADLVRVLNEYEDLRYALQLAQEWG